MVKIGISMRASGFRWPMHHWWLLFLKFFDSVQFDPLPGPKNDFYWLWTMGYGFRHVLMVQQAQALELKPHLWYNEDLWKKIRHFKYWKPPHSYHIVPILAKKSRFQYRYLEGFKWPVLQNLSLIYIIMRIHEKKFTTFSIGILWTGTLLVFLTCGCCTENPNT